MKKKPKQITLDAVECESSDTRFRLCWRGWSMRSKLGQAPIQISINGQRAGTPEVVFQPRPDVVQQFPQLEEEGLYGFTISWAGLWEDFDSIKNLELSAVRENENIQLWVCEKQELNKLFSEQAVHYAFDNKRIDDKNIEMSGWCLAKMGGALCISLTDSHDEEVPFEKKTVSRPDVSAAVLGDNSQPQCGFVITFPYQIDKLYTLCFQNALQSVSISIQPKAMRKQMLREENRRYLPLSQIIRKTNLGLCLKDGNLLLKKGPKALHKEWLHRYAKPAYIYETWYASHKAGKQELEKQRKEVFDYQPKISIIVPAYQTPETFLSQMIASVQNQTYSNWELCIADGGVKDTTVETAMRQYCERDSRIKYKKLKQNYGISGNTNAALELAEGDYVALLDHDDLLAPNALYEVVKAINQNKADVLYSDEDKISMDLKHHFEPHFKPDLNMGQLLSNNYICHLFVAKKSLVDRAGTFRSEYDGAQDFDFILRCVELAEHVYHIPKILYHWRMHQNSTAANPESKMYCYEAGKHAIESYLKRHMIDGQVHMLEHLGYYRVTYPVKKTKLLSVLLLESADTALNETSINSLKQFVRSVDLEILSVPLETGDTRHTVAAINKAAGKANGELLLILQAGMELLSEESVTQWIGQCEQEDVAIVGAKIVNSNHQVVSCGEIYSKTALCPLFIGIGKDDPGYFARAKVQQDLSVLPLNGAMIKREELLKNGDWNVDLPRELADADLCLRIGQTRKKMMLDPGIELLRSEKPTGNTLIDNSERERFISKWKSVLEAGDPAYNPNLDDELGNFKIRI